MSFSNQRKTIFAHTHGGKNSNGGFKIVIILFTLKQDWNYLIRVFVMIFNHQTYNITSR